MMKKTASDPKFLRVEFKAIIKEVVPSQSGDGSTVLRMLASGTKIDSQGGVESIGGQNVEVLGDRVTPGLLEDMCKQAQAGTVYLIPSHHETLRLGQSVDADIQPMEDGSGQELFVNFELLDDNPMVPFLLKEIERGYVPDCSVGMFVRREVNYDQDEQGYVGDLMEGMFEHVALTRPDHAAYPDAEIEQVFLGGKEEEKKKAAGRMVRTLIAPPASKGFVTIMKRKSEATPSTVHSLVFDKKRFPTLGAVKGWAGGKGYPTKNIEETEDGKFALGVNGYDKFLQESLRTIPIAEGVLAVVGRQKAASGRKGLVMSGKVAVDVAALKAANKGVAYGTGNGLGVAVPNAEEITKAVKTMEQVRKNGGGMTVQHDPDGTVTVTHAPSDHDEPDGDEAPGKEDEDGGSPIPDKNPAPAPASTTAKVPPKPPTKSPAVPPTDPAGKEDEDEDEDDGGAITMEDVGNYSKQLRDLLGKGLEDGVSKEDAYEIVQNIQDSLVALCDAIDAIAAPADSSETPPASPAAQAGKEDEDMKESEDEDESKKEDEDTKKEDEDEDESKKEAEDEDESKKEDEDEDAKKEDSRLQGKEDTAPDANPGTAIARPSTTDTVTKTADLKAKFAAKSRALARKREQTRDKELREVKGTLNEILEKLKHLDSSKPANSAPRRHNVAPEDGSGLDGQLSGSPDNPKDLARVTKEMAEKLITSFHQFQGGEKK